MNNSTNNHWDDWYVWAKVVAQVICDLYQYTYTYISGFDWNGVIKKANQIQIWNLPDSIACHSMKN